MILLKHFSVPMGHICEEFQAIIGRAGGGELPSLTTYPEVPELQLLGDAPPSAWHNHANDAEKPLSQVSEGLGGRRRGVPSALARLRAVPRHLGTRLILRAADQHSLHGVRPQAEDPAPRV